MDISNNHVIDGRYVVIDKIGQGGMGIVYKTRDLLTKDYVALKHVLIDKSISREETLVISSSVTTNFNVVLANEFKIMASMRHPNIISVLDYGFDDSRPYFTMPLLDEPRTLIEAAHFLTASEKIDLLIELLQALVYLHRRSIVHRDLKPSNVLVTPQDHIQLVDFGLASITNVETDPSGTLAYMAPEVLQGLAATAATDLFSIGIMAYEMFAEIHPFYSDNPSVMMNSLLWEEPDWKRLTDVLEASDLGTLEQVIMRLLLKERNDRYHNANDVITDIRAHIGLSPLVESGALRSSYLEAARFIGRDYELNHLQNALDQTIRGNGSSWLVGGESGVGKSRLAEELRVRALVKGFIVCRGRSSKQDSSTSRLWREILRPLLIQSEISPIEAAILKPLIPDIGQLTGHNSLPKLNLKPEESQKQQLSLVESVITRQKRPILIILEDLHWMGEGLRVLQHINQIVKYSHVLVIGNYRNDERPQLPGALPEMTLLTLERFSENTIADLSTAMIGAEIGQQPEIIELLKRETEGNVFFIIQVLRSLASNVAQLGDIDVKNLPETVFSGGINEVIQTRLAQLPDHALPLLKLTALVGRSIDHKLMAYLTDATAFSEWLNLCHQMHILEVEGNNWSFSHDKIREYVAREMLSEQEKIQLHRQIAAGIEVVYADMLQYMDKRLIYHHERGQQFIKAIQYLDASAELALQSFENQQVLDDISHIWELINQMGASSGNTTILRFARWERMAGEAKYAMRILIESNEHFERALDVLSIHQRQSVSTEHYLEAARTMSLLVPIYIYTGEWDDAIEAMQEVLLIYQKLNEQTKVIEIMSDIPWLYYLRGYFYKAIECFDDNIVYGETHTIPDLINVSLLGKALSITRIGKTDDVQQALAMVELALASLNTSSGDISNFDRMMTYAIAGAVNARAGHYQDALQYAELAMNLAKKIGNNSYLIAAGYNSIAGTHLAYWQHLKLNGQAVSKSFRRQVRDALNLLHQYAQMVPIARPRAWIYQAWFYSLADKPDKAEHTVATGFSEAFNHNMNYDEALAYDFLAGLLPLDDPRRKEVLQHTLDVFESLGAEWDAARVSEQLNVTDDE